MFVIYILKKKKRNYTRKGGWKPCGVNRQQSNRTSLTNVILSEPRGGRQVQNQTVRQVSPGAAEACDPSLRRSRVRPPSVAHLRPKSTSSRVRVMEASFRTRLTRKPGT